MTTELTKAAQQALEACPFCGGYPKRVVTQLDERFAYAIEVAYVCGCGCRRAARGDYSKGGYADNSKVEGLALSAWNTRALTQRPAAQTLSHDKAYDWTHRIAKLQSPAAQQLAAVETLKSLGYTYHGGDLWKPPLGKRPAAQAFPDECVASGQSCQYGPYGPHGEKQCRYCGASPSLPAPQQATPDVPETDFGNMAPQQAAGEPVGEPAGYTFVQPVPEQCDRIIWRGQYIHLPITRPAPGVPEGWAIERRTDMSPTALVVRSPKNGPGFLTVENNHANIAYRMLYRLASDLLAAAQAKGDAA